MIRAQQGHRYRLGGRDVLALGSGTGQVPVAPIEPASAWPLGAPQQVSAQQLQPLPMRYFHGQVPR